MKVGSLCTGYGGLEIAVTELFKNARLQFVSDIDPEVNTLLNHHHKKTPNLEDLTNTDWTKAPEIDLLSAGYPCQPFSTAGKRKGEQDDRAIFEYIADGISILRPRWVLLENVAGHITLGGTSVIATLTKLGYDSRWGTVSASEALAPHKRSRLFIWANNRNTTISDGRYTQPETMETTIRQAPEFRESTCSLERWGTVIGRPHPEYATEDNRVNPKFVEWLMGLPDGYVTDIITDYSSQLRILGNGVVPQQAKLAISTLLKNM